MDGGYLITFSIVAKDRQTGEMGVAVQSHWFSVGSGCPWGRAGIGAVATQAMADTSYGPLGLELMASGKSAREALAGLVRSDRGRDNRQVGMVDSAGRAAAYTGRKCVKYAGHVVAKGYCCQGNIMKTREVWTAMSEAYERRNDLVFAERLVAALIAGQGKGGDTRGMQSAAILVVSRDVKPSTWLGVELDLRVEDHPDPIRELLRLVRLHRAYALGRKANELQALGRIEESLRYYEDVTRMAPEIVELRFRRALSQYMAGQSGLAKSTLKDVYKDRTWVEVTKRMEASGRLPKGFLAKVSRK